jgi:hypothetical protein
MTAPLNAEMAAPEALRRRQEVEHPFSRLHNYKGSPQIAFLILLGVRWLAILPVIQEFLDLKPAVEVNYMTAFADGDGF